MATKTFTITYDAGASLYLAIFRPSDGYVLDFAGSPANTFRALGSATTPYVSATERTGPGGSSKSLYTAAVDLANVNSGSTPTDYVVQWFTDTGLTALVSEDLGITVKSSDFYSPDSGNKATTEPTGPPSATATPAEILAWLLALTRNKVVVTNGEIQIYNDAGTEIAKSLISDDGTQFTAAEVSTP